MRIIANLNFINLTYREHMSPDQIKAVIEAGLSDCQAVVESPDGVHFTAMVVSTDFLGKNRVQKQQAVYTLLHTYLTDGSLHALSLKTFTPSEWLQHQQTSS